MINYRRKGLTIFGNAPLREQMIAFRDPICVALVSALLSVALFGVTHYCPNVTAVLAVYTDVYSTLTALLGFLVVFRTSQASSRFWEGCSLVHGMMGDFFDSTSTLMAFLRSSPADPTVVAEYQQVVVRLVSLLNAMILGELEGQESTAEQALEVELLDVQSFERESMEALNQCTNRPEVVFQWIQGTVVEMISTGVLNIPPPLATRIFQQLGSGMVKYHESLKFPDVPVPFPYVATAEVLLYFHTAVTPIMSVQWSNFAFQPPIFTFIFVFILWSLHMVAGELENPFEGTDVNDLDMETLQMGLNAQLLSLLSGPAMRLPRLIHSAPQAAKRLQVQARYHAKSNFNSFGFNDFHPEGDVDTFSNYSDGENRPIHEMSLVTCSLANESVRPVSASRPSSPPQVWNSEVQSRVATDSGDTSFIFSHKSGRRSQIQSRTRRSGAKRKSRFSRASLPRPSVQATFSTASSSAGHDVAALPSVHTVSRRNLKLDQYPNNNEDLLERQICVPHPSVPPRCPDFDLSGEKLEKDSDERQTLGTDLDSRPLKNMDVRRFGASMSALSHLPLTQRKGDSDSVPSEAASVVS